MERHHIAYLCLQATREGQASYAHVHEIIEGLRAEGWTVTLYQPDYAQHTSAVPLWRKLLAFVLIQVRLALSIRRYQAVYVRAHPTALPFALWAKLMRVPTIQEVNGNVSDLTVGFPWTRHFEGFFTWLITTPHKLADAVVVVTTGLEAWIKDRLPDKPVYVIPNGANHRLFHPQAVPQKPLDFPYAIFFGALAPWQGIDTLLHAVGDPAWHPEIKLVIVGDGTEKQKIDTFQAQSPHHDRIVVLGKLPYQQMPGIIAQSIVSLSPQNDSRGSTATGLAPLKVFESAACGVPVIVTDFPGMADFVRDQQCGIVIPIDDGAALAQAVHHLYAHPEERQAMGKRGRVAVERDHSWASRAADTAQALHAVIQKKHNHDT